MIKDQENLEAMTTTIEGVLSVEVNAEDGSALSKKIAELSAIISTSANAVAIAEKLYNQKLCKLLADLPDKMNSTEKKLILTGKLSNEIYWVKLAERQNAAIVHAIDGYRSVLSFLKEEVKMSNQNYN